MQLKLDENFGRRGAEILAAAGHDVASVPGEDLCRAGDPKYRSPADCRVCCRLSETF